MQDYEIRSATCANKPVFYANLTGFFLLPTPTFFPAPIWRFIYFIHYFSLLFWSQSNCTSPRGGYGTPTSTRIDWWESCDGNNHPIWPTRRARDGAKFKITDTRHGRLVAVGGGQCHPYSDWDTVVCSLLVRFCWLCTTQYINTNVVYELTLLQDKQAVHLRFPGRGSKLGRRRLACLVLQRWRRQGRRCRGGGKRRHDRCLAEGNAFSRELG